MSNSLAYDVNGSEIKLPSFKKVNSLMRNNKWVKRKYDIISAYVVGSVAKGLAHKESDIDIAIVIPKVKGKTALKVTELYHSKFSHQFQLPHYEGRCLDFQFFYEDDKEIDSYSKIEIK